MAAPAVTSIGASVFAGASSTSVETEEINNSQRDNNKTIVIINVGGPNSDLSRATLAASETTMPGSGINTPSDQEQSPISEASSISADSGFGSETSLKIAQPTEAQPTKAQPTETQPTLPQPRRTQPMQARPSQEQRLAEETVSIGHVIYRNQMLLKKNGMPLYVPQPITRHSSSYQRQGVSIGDVGVFTEFGGFDRLFNICLPARHSMNPDILPKGFCPLEVTPEDVNRPVCTYSSNSYMANPSVPLTGKTFRCTEPEGAILTMPQGAFHEAVVNTKIFRTYLSIHLASWYDYANIVRGREIDNGKIHLVIGCDKTSSWGIATYSHRQSNRVEDNVTYLSFDVTEESRNSLYLKYAWDTDGMAEGSKVGPEEVELLDPPEYHAIMPLRNQCTFLRSLNPALGDDEWKQHELEVATAAEVRALAQPTRKSPLASILGAIGALSSRLGFWGGHGTSRLTDSMAPAQTLANHPATPILDMLLQKCPRAKVVVVNDSDWCSVIRDSDKDWVTTAQDLPRRIQEAFDIVEDEGTAYLQEKKPSQPPNTLSHISVEIEDDLPLFRDHGPLQSFDPSKASPSDVEIDSPPKSLNSGLVDRNNEIKLGVYHDSAEGNDDEDNSMSDIVSLESTFCQGQKVMDNPSSEESALGGEVNRSQRDQNPYTSSWDVERSNSDASSTTLVASETGRPVSVRNIHLDQEQSSIPRELRVFANSGFASGANVSPPTDESPVKKETSNAIYARHMSLKGHGFPLWIPQPNIKLSISYQRQGVGIGDVGIFTSDGGFDFLFNICLPAGHPSNPDELPEGFSRLDLRPGDVLKFHAHSPGSYMASSSVRKTGSKFKCSDSEGAILIMPQGAYHEDLRNIRIFRDYAFDHAESWYRYTNGPCGREIDNGDLHLVTGCDKTSSWGIATYSHRQSKHVEDSVTYLSFNVEDEGRDSLYRKYAWTTDGMTEDLKTGPEEVELLDSLECHALRPLHNQCTFIRSITPVLSDGGWKRLQLKAEVSARDRPSTPPSLKNPLASVLGAIRSLPGRMGMGTFRFTDLLAPAQTLVAHPATYVVNMLLQKCPNAKVVVVHDSDWCSVIRDSDDDWMSTSSQDLEHRIQEAFDIVEEENGNVYLQEKTRSSQPNTSSHVSIKSVDEDRVLFEDRKPGLSQLFDSYEISPSNVKADSPSRSPKKIVDDEEDGAKPNLLEDLGKADLEAMEGFARDVFCVPSDEEDYPMSDATVPKITPRVHKRKNVSRDDTMFDDDFFGSSNTGTPSFRDSFGQLDTDDALATENASHHNPESLARIRETNLPIPIFFQKDGNDIMLDNNLTRSSKPRAQTRTVASKVQTRVSRKRRKYPGGVTSLLCNRTSITNVKLKSHRTAHLGYKPHPCRHCLRAFTTQRGLLRHLELKTCRTLQARVLETIQQTNQENHMRPSLGMVASSQRVVGQSPLSFLPQPSSDLASLSPHLPVKPSSAFSTPSGIVFN